MAEKGTIELINLFISHTEIQLGDKHDFISFEKLFSQVFVYSDGDQIEHCNAVCLNSILPFKFFHISMLIKNT